MFESKRIKPALLAGLLSVTGSFAFAVELGFKVSGQDRDFAEYLKSATLTSDLKDKDASTNQDYMAAARADYARLVGALYERGFYGGTVSIRVNGREADEIDPLSTPRTINRIDYHVTPGPRFTFGTARVAPLAAGTEIPEGFAPNKPANSALVPAAARAGIEGWRNQGHAKVDVAGQSVTAYHPDRKLNVDIGLTPGPRLRFGPLIHEGESRVRSERIVAIAGLPEGEIYSPEEMKDAADRLRRTGAFRSVVLNEADEIGPGNTLPVTVEVTDTKPRRFGFGAELSSLEGITLSSFWLHRNLWGGAERLRIDGEVSGIGGDTDGIDYILSARLDRPAIFTPDTSHYFDFRLQELDEPDYNESSLRIGTGLSHIFNDNLTGELGVAYQYSEIEDDLGNRTRQHLLFPGKLTFDNRNDPLDATRGVYLGLEVTPFLGLNESGGGARIYSDTRSYFALGRDEDIVLAGRAQLGTVTGADLEDVPADMLFYSGGAGTVRGQGYQSLAVDLGGGNRIGGRSFMAFSAEIRAAVARKIDLVGFADTGYVGRDAFGGGTGDWHSGAGLGLRYDTGIGPIRVDVATPLDDDAGKSFELYIGIGQAF